jgi:hypothetical protein
MENLHQAIKQLWEDYTLPSARGQATDNFPTLWEEEAILDQSILTERLSKRLSKDWVEPYGVLIMKKAPPPKDDGMEIDMKKLFRMLIDVPYIRDIVVIQDLKKYDNVVEYALTSIARERGWEEIETNIYRIK